MLERIKWFGHASFWLDDTPCIVIDPWSIVADITPDVILITHPHYDHCSPADIKKLKAPHTQIIGSRAVADMLDCDVTILRPWQVINVGKASIKAVPAYTFNGEHPPQREDLGFVVSMNYHDIYFSGDTDFIPELRNLRCDIAVLPATSKEGQMTIESLVDFVESARPQHVIPGHIGNSQEAAGKLEVQTFERTLTPLVNIYHPPLTR